MKKRVLFVQPVLAPYWVPRFEELSSIPGLDIHVVLESASFAERPGWNPIDLTGCTVHLTKSLLVQKKVPKRKLNFEEKYTRAIPYGLPFLVNSLNPDAVILCNATQVLLALAAKIRKKFKIGLLLEDTAESQARKSLLVRLFRSYTYRQTDFLFCFSKDAAVYADSLRLEGHRYKSSWSVDSSWLVSSRKDFAKPIRFLFVGQLIERKGVMPLLRAWEKFSQDSPDFYLTLVGDGILKAQVEDYCSSHGLCNVHLVGRVPYSKVKDYYLSSDVFILPTMEDLFGLVTTEAMAFGLPVITSTYSGGREFIQEGHNGYVCDPADIDSIVDSLRKITAKPEMLRRMGENSRELISDCTHERVMQRMGADLIQELEQGERAHHGALASIQFQAGAR